MEETIPRYDKDLFPENHGIFRMRKATGDALSPGLQWNKMALKQNQKLQVLFATLCCGLKVNKIILLGGADNRG